MNKIFLSMAILSITGCGEKHNAAQLAEASSKSVTIKTEITCEQDDGDQWISIGIKNLGAGNGEAYLVQHDSDDNSSKLVKKVAVRKALVNDLVVYSDAMDTLRLTVTKANFKAGTLEIISDGPGLGKLSGLECYKNNEIAFDKK